MSASICFHASGRLVWKGWPSRLKGAWIRYKSKYETPRASRLRRQTASMPSSTLMTFDVTNNSSRGVPVFSNHCRSASPVEPSSAEQRFKHAHRNATRKQPVSKATRSKHGEHASCKPRTSARTLIHLCLINVSKSGIQGTNHRRNQCRPLVHLAAEPCRADTVAECGDARVGEWQRRNAHGSQHHVSCVGK
jgi:hypothetical protein